MAATTSRPWEDTKSSPSGPRESLPSISALTSNLPAGSSVPSPTSNRERDSGGWSSRPESVRSSTYSTGTSAYMSSNTNSYYMSPNRASQLSSASGYTSNAHASADYSIDRNSQGPLSSPPIDGHTRNPLPSLNSVHEPAREEPDRFPPRESRRSSIGSHLNQSVQQLHLNGVNSPYSASVNHSQTSLTASLNQQRGIPSHPLRHSRSTAHIQRSPPMSHSINDGRPGTSARQAPPISAIPRREIVSGQEPIKGQAYAFPDPDGMEPGVLPPNRGLSSRGSGHSAEDVRLGSLARRGSGHTSLASSVLTTDSHLPPGQLHLDDNMSSHHHSLRNSQMSDVLEDEAMDTEDTHTPYSRTPALRVSHKMAERKRRSEMKDLFENLRSQIPSSQGSKSSKWEILSKASDYIKQLEHQAQSGGMNDRQLRVVMGDVEMLKNRELSLASENARLLQELAMLRNQGTPVPVNGHPPPPQAPPQHGVPPPMGHQAPPPPGYPGVPQSYVPPPAPAPLLGPDRSLPPLAPPNGGGMDGIRYSH